MDKIKEDIAAMSANLAAQTPEHVLKVVDPSGELPVSDKLSEAQARSLLRSVLTDEGSLENFTVD